ILTSRLSESPRLPQQCVALIDLRGQNIQGRRARHWRLAPAYGRSSLRLTESFCGDCPLQPLFAPPQRPRIRSIEGCHWDSWHLHIPLQVRSSRYLEDQELRSRSAGSDLFLVGAWLSAGRRRRIGRIPQSPTCWREEASAPRSRSDRSPLIFVQSPSIFLRPSAGLAGPELLV